MEYTVLRRKRKTLGIKVSETGDVLVYAPFNIGIKTIDSIVKSKEDWINKSKNRIVSYNHGDKVLFLGREYKYNLIEVGNKNISIELEGSNFNVYFSGEKSSNLYLEIKEYLFKYYKDDFLKVIMSRIELIANKIGVMPGKVSIRNQKSIWGSCSKDNNISINFKLALAPVPVLDYIILHELCHIIHKNHSKDFWYLVNIHMPDYKEKRNWLKTNSCKPLF